MKSADVAVIGGGILGCFAARNLMRWNLSVVLIEKELDKIPNAKAQQIAKDNVAAIKSSNRRDFRF